MASDWDAEAISSLDADCDWDAEEMLCIWSAVFSVISLTVVADWTINSVPWETACME